MVSAPEMAALLGSGLSIVGGVHRPVPTRQDRGDPRDRHPDLLCLVELRGLFGGMLTTLGVSCHGPAPPAGLPRGGPGLSGARFGQDDRALRG